MALISRVPVWNVNQRPRVRLMPSLTPSKVCDDGPPRHTRISGFASSIWRSVNGRSSDTLGAVRRLGYLRPEARGSFLRSAGAVLYFDNSSAVARSISNQARRRKSLESL